MESLPRYVDDNDATQNRQIQKVITFKCCPYGNMKCLARHSERFSNDQNVTRVNSPEVGEIAIEPILGGPSTSQTQDQTLDTNTKGSISQNTKQDHDSGDSSDENLMFYTSAINMLTLACPNCMVPASDRNIHLPKINIKAGKDTILFLIDSGAAVSVLVKEFESHPKFEACSVPAVRLVTANSGTITSVGHITLTLDIRGKLYEQFFVVANVRSNIIGWDFMDYYKMALFTNPPRLIPEKELAQIN